MINKSLLTILLLLLLLICGCGPIMREDASKGYCDNRDEGHLVSGHEGKLPSGITMRIYNVRDITGISDETHEGHPASWMHSPLREIPMYTGLDIEHFVVDQYMLCNKIVMEVTPEKWVLENGRTLEVRSGFLIICQTIDGHEGIKRILRDIRAYSRAHPHNPILDLENHFHIKVEKEPLESISSGSVNYTFYFKLGANTANPDTTYFVIRTNLNTGENEYLTEQDALLQITKEDPAFAQFIAPAHDLVPPKDAPEPRRNDPRGTPRK